MTSQLLAPGETDLRKIVLAANQALKGKLNSVGTVTLTVSAGSTTVKNEFASQNSTIILFPQTADAMSIDGCAYIAPADVVEGVSFKITHDNNSLADRTFAYAIFG